MPAARLQALALALLLAALAACGRSEVPPDPRPTPQPPAALPAEEPPQGIEDVIDAGPGESSFRFEAYAYDCEGLEVTVRPGDDELTLLLPDRSVTLPKVEAASGANYADGDTGFWGKGVDEAVLTLEGEDTPCQLDRARTPWVDARARGAQFRGLGREPGWHIEVHPERLVMVYQYGRQRVVVPNPGATADPDQPIRRWLATTEEHELQLTVEDRGCTDIMSGESYPSMVRVKLDGRDYSGCGKDLD
jgi:membrane-bound inhibitor of C-type lysozyme